MLILKTSRVIFSCLVNALDSVSSTPSSASVSDAFYAESLTNTFIFYVSAIDTKGQNNIPRL
jgi:hypothetical protein